MNFHLFIAYNLIKKSVQVETTLSKQIKKQLKHFNNEEFQNRDVLKFTIQILISQFKILIHVNFTIHSSNFITLNIPAYTLCSYSAKEDPNKHQHIVIGVCSFRRHDNRWLGAGYTEIGRGRSSNSYSRSRINTETTTGSCGGSLTPFWSVSFIGRYQGGEFCAPIHGGTHLDSPCHFAKDKWCTTDIPKDHLVGPGRSNKLVIHNKEIAHGICL